MLRVILTKGVRMFSLRKKRREVPKQYGIRAAYRQVAVRPEAHKKLQEIADRKDMSIVDAFSELVGV